jgi:competence protein ComEA
LRSEPLPAGEARRRRATATLEALLLLGALVRLGGGLVEALRPARGPPVPVEPITIDVATDPASRLVLLPGIGPSRAAAIEEDRAANGPLPSLDALDRVRGIGPGTVRGIREGRGARAVATGSGRASR